MKTSTELFDLIQSLSQGEKRHFKIYASMHLVKDKNQCIRLFDAIEKQKKYKEDKIIADFGNDPIVKRFAQTKYYLYQLILKSMRSYGWEASTAKKLRGLISEIEFLFEKGLYSHAQKIIDKTLTIAEETENYEIYVEASSYKQQLIVLTRNYEDMHDFLINNVPKRREIVKNIALLNNYRNTSVKMYYLQKNISFQTRDVVTQNKLKSLVEQNLLSETVKHTSTKLQLFKNSMLSGYYNGVEGNIEKGFYYDIQNAELVGNDLGQINFSIGLLAYMNILINACHSSRKKGEIDLFGKYILRLEEFIVYAEKENKILLYQLASRAFYSYSIMFYTYKGDSFIWIKNCYTFRKILKIG